MTQTSFSNAAPKRNEEAGRKPNICFAQLLVLLLVLCLPAVGLSQKRSDRGKSDDKSDSVDKVGPKRTDRTVPESERVKAITKPEFIKIVAKPNKGYLSVVAIPAALVTLTPITTDQKKGTAVKETIKDEDGSLNLINLLPGSYKLVIEHADYHPYSETIKIDPARPETFVALNKMVSKYGAIRIGGAPADAKVFLDDAAVNPSSLTLDSQGAAIPKVATGKHRLKVSKAGYVDFAKEIEVLPGEQSFVSAQLELARVTLNLISQPGGRVYVGSEERATVPSDGRVSVSLAPGRHTILVSLDGYQDWKKELTLSLANNPVNESASLIPIPSSAEGDWQPSLGARKWYLPPPTWKLDASGATIKGDQPVLFDTEPNRNFNVYRDFKLEFDVVLTNGRGASWVARAKDVNNYYLFEINIPPGKTPIFNFYICRDGKLQWMDSRPIVEKIDKKGDSFHIIFEARGNRFDTRMTIASAPSTKPHLIGIFQDDSFSYGGIGFRGKDQSEYLLQTLFVIPLR
jgi:hypothetical protein